jgi:hypothetical protein
MRLERTVLSWPSAPTSTSNASPTLGVSAVARRSTLSSMSTPMARVLKRTRSSGFLPSARKVSMRASSRLSITARSAERDTAATGVGSGRRVAEPSPACSTSAEMCVHSGAIAAHSCPSSQLCSALWPRTPSTSALRGAE